MRIKSIGPNIFAENKLLIDSKSKLANSLHIERIISGVNDIRLFMNNQSTKILFKKLGREHADGQFDFDNNTIEIDPRRHHVRSILSTICHEMVHAEQFNNGILQAKAINKRTSIFYWKDSNGTTEFNSRSMLKNKKYKELPWEAEAYAREPLIVQAVYHL